MTAGEEWVRSAIGRSTPETITVCGLDLAQDLMGKVSFTELVFMLLAHRLPTSGEARVLGAVLVSLTDHGLTPTVLASRLTYTGAPESLQGAIAAGLLGGGSVFLGPTEDTARFLHGLVTRGGVDADTADEPLRRIAEDGVRARLDEGQRIPGLGHSIHKTLDPRVPRLYEIAGEEGMLGPHLRLLQAVAQAGAELSGRRLPINGAGAAGAALADLGIPPELGARLRAARPHRRPDRAPGRGAAAAPRHVALSRDRASDGLREQEERTCCR